MFNVSKKIRKAVPDVAAASAVVERKAPIDEVEVEMSLVNVEAIVDDSENTGPPAP